MSSFPEIIKIGQDGHVTRVATYNYTVCVTSLVSSEFLSRTETHWTKVDAFALQANGTGTFDTNSMRQIARA